MLVVAAALLGTLVSISTQTYFTDSLVKVAIVVALYVFIGNSGVLSFGHISFVALGAWTAGVLSVPPAEKPAIMPEPRALPRASHDRQRARRSLLAAVVGGVARFVVGIPLMRLSGLAAGIATFAVLEITHNLLQYEERIGPGLNTFSSVPETTGLRQAAIGAVLVHRRRVRLRAQPVRPPPACDARGRRGGAGGRRLGLPPAARRVRRLGPARRARGRPVRPPAPAAGRVASTSI